MKLTTWNVNGIRSVLNKGALQEYILEAQPVQPHSFYTLDLVLEKRPSRTP